MHPNMPGQYKLLAKIYAEDKNNQVVFLTKPGKPDMENIIKVEYAPPAEPPDPIARYLNGVYLNQFARDVRESKEVREIAKKMKAKGFVPDIIVGHLGWGNGLFLKDIYPDTPILSYAEYFFTGYNSARCFLEKDTPTEDELARQSMRNAALMYTYGLSDWCITPTFFQRDSLPQVFHSNLSVLHDGIDTNDVRPDPDAVYKLPNGLELSRKDKVITYVSPVFEPHRGFPNFMRAIEIVLRERPDAHVVLVGSGHGRGYGGRKKKGDRTHLQEMLEEIQIDRSRFHHVGGLPHKKMVNVMQISSAHIYLTVPFVLSWSFMEAMSAGCVMIGSNTDPVQEVLEDKVNGLIADFFSPKDIAEKIMYALDNQEDMQPVRDAARETVVRRYSLEKVLPLHMDLIRDLALGQTPPNAAAEIKAYNRGAGFIDD